jgi:hypothetical protein
MRVFKFFLRSNNLAHIGHDFADPEPRNNSFKIFINDNKYEKVSSRYRYRKQPVPIPAAKVKSRLKNKFNKFLLICITRMLIIMRVFKKIYQIKELGAHRT